MMQNLIRPALPAFIFIDRGVDGHSNFGLALWCPYCRKVRIHDRHAGLYVTGHCFQDNPECMLAQTGYALREAGYVTSLDDLRPISECLSPHFGQ